MRKTILALALIMASSPAMAGSLVCFYDENGNLSGRDGGTDGIPESQFGQFVDVSERHSNSAYTWGYVIADRDTGETCPASKQ